MATRMAVRYLSRRLSSSGKVLSEEEKAAENIYTKKIEQEKSQKRAHKFDWSTPRDGSSSDPEVTEEYIKLAIATGAVTIGGALGWYLLSKYYKKPEKVHD